MKKILASLVASAFLLGAPAFAANAPQKPAAHATKHAVAKKAAHVKQKTSAKAPAKMAKSKAKPAAKKTVTKKK